MTVGTEPEIVNADDADDELSLGATSTTLAGFDSFSNVVNVRETTELSVVRTFGRQDDVFEQPSHRATPRPHARELRRGQRTPLAQVYPDGVEVSRDRHDVDAHHVAQPRRRGGVARGDGLELGDRVAQRPLEEAREQLLLRPDVVVEAAP